MYYNYETLEVRLHNIVVVGTFTSTFFDHSGGGTQNATMVTRVWLITFSFTVIPFNITVLILCKGVSETVRNTIQNCFEFKIVSSL